MPFGSGRSVLIGFNPFYRSWKEQDERLVLNAALYPKGARSALRLRPRRRPSRRRRPREIEAAAAPVATAELPETARAEVRPVSKRRP